MTPERITEVKKILEKMNPGSQLFPITVGDLLSLLATLEETEQQNVDLKAENLVSYCEAAKQSKALAEAQQTIARQREALIATGLPEWAVDAIGEGAKES